MKEASAKDPEIQGFLKKWSRARIPFQLAIYLDILSPVWCLVLSMQDETHNPVKQVCRIQEFEAMMEKLKTVLVDLIDTNNNLLTYYT